MKKITKQGAKTFDARLELGNSNLKWVIVQIPFDVNRVWGARGLFKVKGDINGFHFRTSLFPTGAGRHTLLVNKRMQAGSGARVGMTAKFHLEPDTEERRVSVPVELKSILAEERMLTLWFSGLNYSTRKWLSDWVAQPKSEEARMRRGQQMAERLLETMEAERELPPVLRVAFANNARASEGWKLMTTAQRRGHLMGIFYYKEPESRKRRIEKVLQEAEIVAERKKIGSSAMR